MERVLRITYSTYQPSSRQYHIPAMPPQNWEMLMFHLTYVMDQVNVVEGELRITFLNDRTPPISTKDRSILEAIIRHAGWTGSPVRIIVTETSSRSETTYTLTVPSITVDDNGRVILGALKLEK